jgi:threonine dehydrogenase-like Zn-dependent dehydrogenase
MKKAVVTGVRKVELQEFPVPKANGDLVVVKIHISPMCTEYKAYLEGEHRDCLGHEAVGYELAALTICGLGPSFGAYQTLGLSAWDTILITGLGPVGIGVVINANYRGARVIAVESNEYRRKLAAELGVDALIDPRDPDAVDQIKSLSGGEGPDCALDCSGAVPVHRLCIDAVRCRGKIAFVGECNSETPIVISRNCSVRASICSAPGITT